MKAIDALVTERPNDPYLWELKGQVLFEAGRPKDAEPAHRRSVELKPDAPLLRINLAQTLIALNDPQKTAEATDQIKQAMSVEPDNALGWRLLAEAYDSQGHDGMARLATAEQKFYLGQMTDARVFALRARDLLKKDSPEWRRATDIILASKPTADDLKAMARQGFDRSHHCNCRGAGPSRDPGRLPTSRRRVDRAFGEKVRAYLMAHPEVLAEASAKYQSNQDAATAAAQKRAEADLPKLRAALERDPRDFVANPDGKVTLTEFYDYRCPHCANIAPKIVELIRSHPGLRVVFKEMPIFGATSQHAAYAAMAVKKAGGDYLGLYQAFMAARPLDDAAIDKLAIAKEASSSRHCSSPASTAQLADTKALFDKLAMDGTPGFVVGKQIFTGEDLDELAAAIVKAQAGR